MNKFVRVLIALVVAVTPMSAITPAQAEPCAYYGTIFDGSPYARNFGTVCGQVNIDAIWPSVEAHINSNAAAYTTFMANKAAEQEARLAAEEAARVAADAAAEAARVAADAANCVGAVSSFTGDPIYETSFPAICTAAGIAARAQAIQDYFDLVTADRAAKQNSAPINPVPPNNAIDCNLEIWRNTAQCLNPTFGIPPTNPANPAGTLNCALPQNAVLPACVNGTAAGIQNPPTFNANSQPMVNADGTINCAQADNAITITCMNLFKLSANGTLDCSRGELKNLPACVNGTAPSGVNAPPPPSNVSTTTSNVPATTGGVVAQPSSPSIQNNSASSSTQVASEKVKQNKEDLFPDADGEEEDPAANLTITYSKSLARYIVKVDSNLAEESLVLRGVKKGAKSLKFTLTTDEDGVAGVKTKTKLSGFTLTLYFGSTKLDSVKVS